MKNYFEIFKIIEGLYYKRPVTSRTGTPTHISSRTVISFWSSSSNGIKSVNDWEILDITRAFLEQLLK